MTRNKFGPSRNIPEDVKREVRRACGFGCVKCGAIPYQYDHFRTPFSGATYHDPTDIILLCDKHHRMKKSGHFGVHDIEQAMRVAPTDRPNRFHLGRFPTRWNHLVEEKSPQIQTLGRFRPVRHDPIPTETALEITKTDFQTVWPGNVLIAKQNIVLIGNCPVLSIEPKEDELEPIMLSASFTNLKGQTICEIKRNELTFRPANIGDFEQTSDRFSFKDKKHRTLFKFHPYRPWLGSERYVVLQGRRTYSWGEAQIKDS